jgi:hypothetical protein
MRRGGLHRGATGEGADDVPISSRRTASGALSTPELAIGSFERLGVQAGVVDQDVDAA